MTGKPGLLAFRSNFLLCEDFMKDYGADPIGDGTFKMVPSGDVVDFEERNKRLPPVDMENKIDTLIGAKTAMQVDIMQGGKMDIY